MLLALAVLVLAALPATSPAVALGGSERMAFVSGPVDTSDTEWGPSFVDTDLYTSTTDGADLRRLTDLPHRVSHPDWSPDGQRIVFASGGDLWVIEDGGSGLTQLTAGPEWDDKPAWSPDGSLVAFERADRIHLVGVDGSGVRRLFPDMLGEDPSWSPDGRFIAFSYPGRQRNIGIADRSGRSWAPLVKREGELNADDPSFARSANRMAYRLWQVSDGGYEGSYSSSEVMVADGTGSRPARHKLLGYGTSSPPHVSPDGSCIAFGDYWEVRVRISCPTGDRYLPGYATYPAWQPSGPAAVDSAVVDAIVVGGNGVVQWSGGGLVPGQRYEIVARGTYAYGPADAVADAECSNGAAPDPVFLPKRYPKQNWFNPLDLSEDPLDLYVGGHAHDGWVVDSPDAAGCSRTHTYRLPFTAEGAAPISFRLADVEPSDNYGVVLVTIRRLT